MSPASRMRWARCRCVLGHPWHAAGELRDHPGGLQAQCGHLLLPGAVLRGEPSGPPCQACAARQLERAASGGGEVSEVPGQHQPESSRPLNRMTTLGYRIVDGSPCVLLVIQEADGWWAIHGAGATGIRLARDRMAVLAGAILVRAR